MNRHEDLVAAAMDMLVATSRTFYIPISRLVPGLKEAVASAYLCMRAIDEIEDHPDLPREAKAELLRQVSLILASPGREAELSTLFSPYGNVLPEVTLRLSDWVELSPETVAPRVIESTSVMSAGMGKWAERNWQVRTEEDLDDYTYCVAGAVGELLSDLWLWYDGTVTDRRKAVAFGRGLQAVNILRNSGEDNTRGVDFFPDRWTEDDMLAYARRNLETADAYVAELGQGPALDFCSIPLALAHGTLNALTSGDSKLTRKEVIEIVNQVIGKGIV